MNELPILHWHEEGERVDEARLATWRSASGRAPPRRVQVVDDTLTADAAYRLACAGTAMLWRGDYQNARQLLAAMTRRADRKPLKVPAGASAAERFHLHRQAKAQRARTLSMLLVPIDVNYAVSLRRAPDVRAACLEAWGPADSDSVVSLRELLGVIGASEWRRKGVPVAALDARIHPHYGVFSPLRGEYIDLAAQARLPVLTHAFDIGTGSGVLAALLVRRGVARVVATELDTRALACAADNLERLGCAGQIELVQCDLFPDGSAPLIVCNPPWLPARPTSAIEHAIYDPDSRMLRAFLDGLAAHLALGGEGWLMLSDIAEHLGLRSREALMEWITAAGLRVIDRLEIRPRHGKAEDESDPLHAARAAEVTSLWRLTHSG